MSLISWAETLHNTKYNLYYPLLRKKHNTYKLLYYWIQTEQALLSDYHLLRTFDDYRSDFF